MTAPKKVLPSISMVKTEPKQGSVEWMRKAVDEHGKTTPLCLEKRRKGLSASILIVNNVLRDIQAQKKILAHEVATRQAALNEKIKKGGADATEIAQESAELGALNGTVLQLQITIAQFEIGKAQIDGLALVVDCLSFRSDALGKKTKKKGHTRQAIVGYIHDIARDTEYLTDLAEESSGKPREEQEDDNEPMEVDDEEVDTGEGEESKPEEAK